MYGHSADSHIEFSTQLFLSVFHKYGLHATNRFGRFVCCDVAVTGIYLNLEGGV